MHFTKCDFAHNCAIWVYLQEWHNYEKCREEEIQEKCANKSRGDMLTQMLLAVSCAELLPSVGFCLLSVIVLMDFEVCTKNLTVHVSDTSANKFATSLHVSDV